MSIRQQVADRLMYTLMGLIALAFLSAPLAFYMAGHPLDCDDLTQGSFIGASCIILHQPGQEIALSIVGLLIFGWYGVAPWRKPFKQPPQDGREDHDATE